jgi:hypothetical protein
MCAGGLTLSRDLASYGLDKTSDGTNPQGALSALEPCSDFGALCFLSAALAGDARMVCHLHLWARVTSYHAWLSYMVVL